MQLDAKIWRPFRLLDMFDAVKGDQNNMADLKTGDLPLISAKDNTNGLKGFVADNGRKIFRGHCLTLNNEGSGTGLAFYQSFDFLLDTHVTALFPKVALSRATLLFIATCIRQQRGRYGFGYSLTNTRLMRLCVMLPVNEVGEPDFEFMEAYIVAIEEKILQRYRDYIAASPPPD